MGKGANFLTIEGKTNGDKFMGTGFGGGREIFLCKMINEKDGENGQKKKGGKIGLKKPKTEKNRWKNGVKKKTEVLKTPKPLKIFLVCIYLILRSHLFKSRKKF